MSHCTTTAGDKKPIQAVPAQTILPLPAWKRACDLVGASILVVILLPLFAAIAAIIKAGSSGPVFFRHQRYGLGGDPLLVWKFRTMHVATNPNDHRQHLKELMHSQAALDKLKSPGQIVPLGGLLRSTALDELPQLINVLRGEMSLVGPRPDVLPIEEYGEDQRLRFSVVPGMTGLWQVSGKNKTTFAEMVQLDAAYIARRSLLLDLKIILLTIPAIIANAGEELVG